MNEIITSTANERVKRAASLARRRNRESTGWYLAEGPHVVDEALRTGGVVEVFRTPDSPVILTPGVRETLVAPHVLAKLSDARTPQGVVAVVQRRPATLDDVVGRGVLVVVDRVADPGNAGTLVRTVDAFGCAGLVLTAGSVDPWNPKAVRAAAGSTPRVALVTGVDGAAVAAACRRAGQPLIGLDARAPGHLEAALPPDPATPVALVLGSEAHGLSSDLADRLDRRAAIAAGGPAESLNLAAAAAVATYVATRGRAPGGAA